MATWTSLLLLVFATLPTENNCLIDNLTEAQWFLDNYNTRAQEEYYVSAEAAWTYNTNLTDNNNRLYVAASLKATAFENEAGMNATKFNYTYFPEAMKRQFAGIADIGTSAMTDQVKLERLATVMADMEALYSKGTVCLSDNRCMQLEPGLTRLMAESRDYKELAEVWARWRTATGKKIKPLYEEFVSLSNEAIRVNKFPDTGAWWRSWYESSTFETDVENLYNQLSPLYDQLHAYTRKKLKEVYGASWFPSEGHIPAHLLGNMWSQTWSNVLNILQPYKGKQSVDVTPTLKAKGYNARKLFNISEEFFTSLGLHEMPDLFWEKSMITRPTDGRDVVCHASAWDFSNQKDFRIKQCTDITMEDLVTVHHEMGHIQYYLQYKDLPFIFRGGANPGFHEAVGDVLALSVATPKHLKEIGLLETVQDDTESDINFLLSMALDKIAFLPFGYLMDQWRWNVFNGAIEPSNYNSKWWDLRCKYQGITPPSKRTNDDFDPGAKYHIPANTPYIRYFVSFIIQFQFHKALCQAANQTGPLYKCDIYRSKEAGTLLGNMLQLGQSKPWPEAMEQITGQRGMDATPIIDYFQPLIDWLKIQNAGEKIGWSDACPPIVEIPTSLSPKLLASSLLCIFVIVAALFI